MRSSVRAAIGIAALLVCGTASAGGAPGGVVGSWSGDLRQIDPTAETKYPMTLSITAKGAKGSSAYPSLKCKGTWTRLAQRDGYSIYREKVTNEPGASCVDGIVTVKNDGGKLILGWFGAYEGEPYVAAAALNAE